MKPTIRSLLLACCALCPTLAHALSDIEANILAHIDQEMPQAMSLLEKTVNINSGTMNPVGVKQVGHIFMDELSQLGFDCHWLSLPPELHRAGHVWAEKKGLQGKRLLLIGHLDTVFEADNPFQQFQLRGDQAHGPGVIDMKGGDVAIIFALRALKASGALEDAQITVALMGDEEHAGRPTSVSRAPLIETAKRSDIALEFEFGGETIAQVVTARRGVSRWQLEVTSKSSHSAKIFSSEAGVGAILGATELLHAFYQDLLTEKYLTFNPGVILGGTQITYEAQQSQGTVFGKENIMASDVLIEGDLRFISGAQERLAREHMKKIAASAPPLTQARITFIDGYPAMAPSAGNAALLAQLSHISEELGVGPLSAFPLLDRGASDVSFVANYVDALAGLGAIGGGAHTQQEYMDVKQFPAVIKRAALLIYRLTRAGS